MTYQQTLTRMSINVAGDLAKDGCRVLSAHAHDQRPVVIASLPPRISLDERARLLARSWQSPMKVEWRN